MGVGYIQIVTTGNNKEIFNRDPQISFFKIYYRRHTNFFINNFVTNGNNILIDNDSITNQVSWVIPKNGDFLSKTYITLNFNDFYFELFNQYDDLFCTLNIDILDLYDSFYMKINNFNANLIKNINIFKGSFIYKKKIILQLLSTNITNYLDFLNLIVYNKSVTLEISQDNIFYNLNQNFDFYSFNIILDSNSIIDNNIFNYFISNIDVKILLFIRIDFLFIN